MINPERSSDPFDDFEREWQSSILPYAEGMYYVESLHRQQQALVDAFVDHQMQFPHDMLMGSDDEIGAVLTACNQSLELALESFSDFSVGDEVRVSGQAIAMLVGAEGTVEVQPIENGSFVQGRMLAVQATEVPALEAHAMIFDDNNEGCEDGLFTVGVALLLDQSVVSDRGTTELLSDYEGVLIPINYPGLLLERIVRKGAAL